MCIRDSYKPGEVTLRVMTSSMLFNDSVRAVLIANLEAAGFKVDSLAVDQALFNTCLLYTSRCV